MFFSLVYMSKLHFSWHLNETGKKKISRLHLCTIYTIPSAVSLFQFVILFLLYNRNGITPCPWHSLMTQILFDKFSMLVSVDLFKGSYMEEF